MVNIRKYIVGALMDNFFYRILSYKKRKKPESPPSILFSKLALVNHYDYVKKTRGAPYLNIFSSIIVA
jgi:hypothetical protein